VTRKKDKLDEFYAALKGGLTIEDFLRWREQIFRFVKSSGLTDDYVLGRGRVDKLRDEVIPVARFVKEHARPDDKIRFALDDSFPDCVVSNQHGRQREIEVTVARAKERVALMEQAIKGEEIHGIINLQDCKELSDFRRHAEQAGDRDKVEAYSTEQLFGLIIDAVEQRAKRKAFLQADTLLIEVVPDMYGLADNRCPDLQNLLLLSEEVKQLSFSDVYIVGYGHQGDICLKIK
jgi:hypothetical protein